jgi:hypothetical protein
MSTGLSGFIPDKWYKVMIGVGGAFFAYSITVKFIGIENKPIQQISAAMFFIGLGEWINHPLRCKIVPATFVSPGYTTSGHHRSPSLIGRLFDILGGILLIAGANNLTGFLNIIASYF